ncbi:MAG: HAMP domain-containing sensor histidine kinase [Myxococcota bacterium]|nr:HAMP domain-containing sensor histidine kinase [Myxococcota bacterium]
MPSVHVPRSLGLRLQIVLSLAALMGVILGLLAMGVGTLLPAVVEREVGEARVEMARAMARNLSAAAASPDGGRALIHRALAGPGVTGVAVWDRSGRAVTVETPGAPPMRPTAQPSFSVPRVSETAAGTIVLEPSPDRSATAAVRVTLGAAGDRARSLQGLLLMYLGLSVISVLVFGYVALTRLIVRPVERIAAAARRLGEGRDDARAQAAGGRELVELASAFNAMAEEVATHRRGMEEQIASLERVNAELRLAQEQVTRSAKLASVGQLAAGIAHEIGNPLTVVLGFFEVLESVEPIAPEAREYLARMRAEAERVNRIIRNLLDYARAKPGPTEPTSVRSVVDSTVALLAPQKPFRGVEIRATTPADLPLVPASDDRLRQVLVNLLMNAAEAMGEGGGTVSVTAEWTALPDGRAGVRISVADTGPGIPAHMVGSLFDPFVTTKSPGAGTGLGLAVCLGIVEGLGGTMAAANLPEGGARFDLILPAVEPDSG